MLIRRELSAKASGVLCAVIVIGILVAGLWPFNSPSNGVTWMPVQRGVHLGKRSTMLSSGPLPGLGSNAWFLEQVDAKGIQNGDIRVADYHANLIYNEGLGTARQVCEIVDDLKARVQVRFGFSLEEEVQYVGFADR